MGSQRRLWSVLLFAALLNNPALSKKILCYYSKTSEDRDSSYRLYPQDIDVSICTHIVYACSIPDLVNGILPTDFVRSLTSDGSTEEFTKLRQRKRDQGEILSLVLSIGGWNEGSLRFSKLAASSKDTEWFARHVCEIVRYIDFDGLDIDWQWPGQRQGGTNDDRNNLVKLLQAIRGQIKRDAAQKNKVPIQLSVVLPPFKEMADKGFNLDAIKSEVDLFTLLTMDYYSSTDPHVNHHAPLHSISYRHCNKQYNVENTVEHYLRTGLEPEKLMLGIPFYGNSYTLSDDSDNGIGAEAEDEGVKGFATDLPGTLAYFEICQYIKDFGWRTVSPNASALGPYAVRSSNWVAFDDVQIVKKKAQFAMGKCLGGVMLWTIDMDDFKGWCGGRFPLTRAAKETVMAFDNEQSCASTLSSNQTSEWKPFKYIKREKWEAEAADSEIPRLRVFPAPYVIVAATISQPCYDFQQCKTIIKNIQTFQMSQGYGDIGYSFLVGGDGNVYEGLGWNRHGAHTLPFNARSLAVAFVGDFRKVEPPQKQVDAARKLVDEAVRLGQIKSDYKVFGQRQVVAVDSPGNKLMDVIKTWPHWAEYDPVEDD